MAIEVFITNVTKKKDAVFLKKELTLKLPQTKINFDLDDVDKILRLEKANLTQAVTESVISCLNNYGFECKILTY